MNDTLEIVTQILIDKIGVKQTEATPDANFIQDLGVDSLDFAEIVMEFEQVFDIKIPDSEAEGLETIADAVTHINEKRKNLLSS